MSLTIRSASTNLSATILLTGSKSESNRALIIKSLCRPEPQINNLSEAQDTVTLQRILRDLPVIADVGPAGTAMRFLAARLAIEPSQFVLTGTERMKARPIGILVDALKDLGADIEYLENPGFPPLKINGRNLPGGEISIDGSVSSQYISALCLIAPSLSNGLKLNFAGEIASKPYLDMTLQMMKEFGAGHNWNAGSLIIPSTTYQPNTFTVEPDWSAASYWYAVAALSQAAEITLPNLKADSLQGDAEVSVIFRQFGVSTSFTEVGITIRKENTQISSSIDINCERCPDLAQTLATTIAALGISGTLRGLKSLRIKETDRITALIAELSKFGIEAIEHPDFVLEIKAGKLQAPLEEILTYEDHRMAMAFAPLVLKVGEITFDDEKVVAKSYPDFWKHLQQARVID